MTTTSMFADTFESNAEAMQAKRAMPSVSGFTVPLAQRLRNQLIATTAATVVGGGIAVLIVRQLSGDASAATQAVYGMGVFCAALVANAIVTLRLVQRDVLDPLDDVSATAYALSEGNNDVEVRHADRGDEIGRMAQALHTIKRAAFRFQKMRAERDAAREQHAQQLLLLADRFEGTVADVVSSVASASSQLQMTATTLVGQAEQSSEQTGQVTAALHDAAAGVTAAAAASDQFAMSIGEISRQASNSAQLARDATLAAQKADSTISTLASSAQEVGQIVEMISTIAQRTNLLALNASIEAARGGEAGRGFAVVAAEVKELASQTGTATQQVADQIRMIQDSTSDSVTALRAIAQQINQLESTSVSIAAAVDEQSVAGQDLARSIDVAARSTEGVSSTVQVVREASVATGAAASQVLSSSTELERQAAVLRSQVGEFLQRVRAA